MSTPPLAAPVVLILALLCDEQLYRDMMTLLGDTIEPHVLLLPKSTLEDSVADILRRAPARFALVGTSCGGNLAMEVAPATHVRVTALWLMGCNPAAPQAGSPDLAGGLEATPDPVFEMLAGLVVHKDGALTMPTLVLWGEQDALAPVAVGQALAAALQRAQFEVLPGCGHLPTLEMPKESAAMFAELLKTAYVHVTLRTPRLCLAPTGGLNKPAALGERVSRLRPYRLAD